ncbi:MAG: hypothetical protein LBV31_00850 [Prevotellaceae bacterium]|jgi:hypothetical protein|nr:hypothetical protein [Prevotellaceae bacterium]
MTKSNFKNKYFFGLLLLVACFFASCGDEEDQCRQNMYVVMNLNFYQSVIDEEGAQKNSPLSLTLTAQGEGIDSLLYNNDIRSAITLPLNKLDNHSTFALTLNDTTGTLTVWHSNTEEYLSFECGCLVTFKIDSVQYAGQFIDSLSVINVDINTQNAENIQLYRHYDTRQ